MNLVSIDSIELPFSIVSHTRIELFLLVITLPRMILYEVAIVRIVSVNILLITNELFSISLTVRSESTCIESFWKGGLINSLLNSSFCRYLSLLGFLFRKVK